MMKYKRNIAFWLILFLLTGTMALMSLRKNNKNLSSEQIYPAINITDTLSIDQIILTQAKHKQNIIINHKSENLWELNDKYPARTTLVKLLLFGLHQMQVKRPLEQSEGSMLVSKQSQLLVNVKVVKATDTISFSILPNPNDVNSSIYADLLTNQFYIIHVPGVQGNLATLLSLESNEWRSKEIFRNSPYSIQSIKVQYASNSNDDFEIYNSMNQATVKDLPDSDSVKVKKFLSLIPILAVEKYLDSKNDTIQVMFKQSKPFVAFSVIDNLSIRSEHLQIAISKDGKTMLAKAKSSGDIFTINPQMWRFALVPKTFFKNKRQ